MALLREMQKRHMETYVVICSATISACEKGQRWITAVVLLREMQKWHMPANVITVTFLLPELQQ